MPTDNILVAVDFSDVTPLAIAQARNLASNSSRKIWVVHVAPPDPDFVGYEAGPQSVRDQVASKLHKEHCQLQLLAEDLRKDGIDATALLVQGRTIETIIEEARRADAGMIIVGSHGHSAVYRALVGGTCEGLLRKAPCPVLVVPAPRDRDQPQNS